jgi:Protein of unknown function (DUF3060)
MSDHLSPDQEDPEKRIRELERGLADTSHPAPQQPAPFPGYTVGQPAGPTPTWSPTPVPSGYPGAPTFSTRRSGPRSMRWVGILTGFVLPVGLFIAFAVPWKNFGLFEGLFGPTKVPQGGSLMINDSNATKTVECNDGRLTLNGNNLTVTVTGHCADLFVNGSNHHVTVDSADSIRVNGMGSVVVYHSGRPGISKNGNVTVKQG